MIEHWVEYLYPGILISEDSHVKVDKRSGFKLPKGSFAFRYYDVEVTTQNGERLTGKPKNKSPWYYEGKEMTLADVEREKPSESILLSNMRYNNIKRICMTRYGQALQLNDEDVVLKK